MSSSDDEFLSIAGGDDGLAALLRESLERLRAGVAGKQLQDLAGEVLDGRTNLRSVAQSSEFAEALTQPLSDFLRWYDDASPESRNDAAQAALDAMQRRRQV